MLRDPIFHVVLLRNRTRAEQQPFVLTWWSLSHADDMQCKTIHQQNANRALPFAPAIFTRIAKICINAEARSIASSSSRTDMAERSVRN